MFNKVIRTSFSLLNTCRTCNKHTFKLTRNVPHNKRYINTSCMVFSQQKTKQKIVESDNDKFGEKNDKTKNVDRKANEDHKSNKTDSEANENNEQNNASQDEKPMDEDNDEEFTKKKDKNREKRKVLSSHLIVHPFLNAGRKEKDTFLECLRMYQSQPGRKIERVPFIYSALKYMEEFGVHKDLEVYKEILNIFPKETMVPTNVFQSMFMHYPREQYCATAVLEQMEDNKVMPDPEMELLLLSTFGSHGLPLVKYWKMMYWMPKFRHKNPWPVPDPLPNDTLELAKLALSKISSIDILSEVTIFDTEDIEDSIDKTWIVSAIAPAQRDLLVKHDKKKAIYVEGPFRIYVSTKSVDYFVLRADPDLNRKFPNEDLDDVRKIKNPYIDTRRTDVILPPTVHEQFDSTIFANCATGTSTKDSLLSWIRCLQKTNPVLDEIPVIFTLKNYSNEEEKYIDGSDKKITTEKSNDSDDKTLLQ